MFYSETLLSKTGPLARVWLSANLERKLSKTHILQTNVKDSVDAIVTPNQAPMALRLSGQLLLGVVRIYSRKARYLLDDCNEALIKIKMAFRTSGNNDIPEGLNMPSRDANMLPDTMAEGEDFEMPPMPDVSELLSQMDDDVTSRRRRAGSRDINLQEDYTGSQFLQNSIENNDPLMADDMEDFDLGLDLGLDFDAPEKNVELGRNAPAARPTEDDLLSEFDIQVPAKDNIGERDTSLNLGFEDDGVRLGDDDGDVEMFMGDEPTGLPLAPLPNPRARISESPLSDIDEAVAREVEAEHQRNLLHESTLFEPEPEEEIEESVFHAPQRARKQKIIRPDEETTLSNHAIKEWQTNHAAILQQPKMLPRDPELLALIEMSKNGTLISNILGGGRSRTWAPELRGMLSLQSTRNNLKRKRDSGIADMESGDEQPAKEPRLELGEDEEVDLAAGMEGAANIDAANTTVGADGTIIEMAAADDDGMQFNMDDGNSPAADPNFFDDTTAPLVHPADSGPVSLGTKHAVHLLRDRFGPEAANSPAHRTKASVLFQDLLPEKTTSRADATKMFFEVLVLATKDAVKVEQGEKELGAPIRVRGKRGLWGDWAEREAGGEIETEPEAEAAGVAGPSGTNGNGLESMRQVSVAA